VKEEKFMDKANKLLLDTLDLLKKLEQDIKQNNEFDAGIKFGEIEIILNNAINLIKKENKKIDNTYLIRATNLITGFGQYNIKDNKVELGVIIGKLEAIIDMIINTI
jgi:uncharacterized hydantoinase/oxoprolinase family protein